jgi:hypothetical protein
MSSRTRFRIFQMKQLLTITIIFLSLVLNAQVKDDDYVLNSPRNYLKDPARTSTYIELLGNAGLYSLNWDHILVYKDDFKISGRIGASVFPVGYHIEQAYVLENNYIFGQNPHHLELGPGLTLQRKYNPVCSDTSMYPKYNWESVWFGMFRIGYRFQDQADGFFFKAGLTPIFYRKYDCATDIPPAKWFWLGIAIGVSY